MSTEYTVTEERKEATLNELFGELDLIIEGLEDRDISLESAFQLYELGMQKVQQCNAKLDQVEKKMLVISRDGAEVPFEA